MRGRQVTTPCGVSLDDPIADVHGQAADHPFFPLDEAGDVDFRLSEPDSVVPDLTYLVDDPGDVEESLGWNAAGVEADPTEDIVPLLRRGKEQITADIVGPICESSDVFAKDRTLESVNEGELVCIRTAGAYGFSMASQYNGRPRAAEVLVRGGGSDLIRARESFQDLIRGEKIPGWLWEEK